MGSAVFTEAGAGVVVVAARALFAPAAPVDDDLLPMTPEFHGEKLVRLILLGFGFTLGGVSCMTGGAVFHWLPERDVA